MTEETPEVERFHSDFAVPLEFYVGTGEFSGDVVVILDLRLVVPMAPEIGEQRAVLVLNPADAINMAAALKDVGESVPSFPESNQAAESAGEETE